MDCDYDEPDYDGAGRNPRSASFLALNPLKMFAKDKSLANSIFPMAFTSEYVSRILTSFRKLQTLAFEKQSELEKLESNGSGSSHAEPLG